MSICFSVDQMASGQRAAAWRDVVCSTFVALECEPKAHLPMHGKLEAFTVDDLHVSRVKSSAQTVRRTRDLINQANDAYVLMSLQLNGRTLVQQASNEAMLTAGCCAFYDTAQPYTLSLPEEFDQIVLHLPREQFDRLSPHWLTSLAQKVPSSNPYAQALSALVPQLFSLAREANQALLERTAQSVVDLMALALSSVSNESRSSPVTQAPIEPAALVWRAQEVIGRRIDQGDLTPAVVAQELKVSLRRLQEAFHREGSTPSDCIWDMRLEHARRLLDASQYRELAVTQLAYRSGFNDMAHFSRRFKQRFGLCPSDYRHNR